MGKEECPYGSKCFAALAKEKAMSADVVVTNHTLLAIEIVDSHPILPERDAIVLDEAHEFMDRTMQAVTEELTAGRVERAAKMARKHMPGKATDAFIKAADKFAEAISEFEGTGRLEEVPPALEGAIRKVKEAASAVVQLINADSDVIDINSMAERARVKGATNEVLVTAQKMLRPGNQKVMWFEPNFKTLYLAPLTVSSVLRDNLLSDTPVIAT